MQRGTIIDFVMRLSVRFWRVRLYRKSLSPKSRLIMRYTTPGKEIYIPSARLEKGARLPLRVCHAYIYPDGCGSLAPYACLAPLNYSQRF